MHQGIGNSLAQRQRMRGYAVQRQVVGIALVVAAEKGDDQVAEEKVDAERDEGGNG